MENFSNLFKTVKGSQLVIKKLEDSISLIKLSDNKETAVFKDADRESFLAISLMYWVRDKKNKKTTMVIPDYNPDRELDLFKIYEVFIRNFEVSDECVFLKKAVVEKNLDSIINLIVHNQYQMVQKTINGQLGNRIIPIGSEKVKF